MSTELAWSDDSIVSYQELKIGRQYKWIIFKVVDSSVVVEKKANKTHDEFVYSLPPRDCRYVVYDFDWYLSHTSFKSLSLTTSFKSLLLITSS
jgi:hypothetical protein